MNTQILSLLQHYIELDKAAAACYPRKYQHYHINMKFYNLHIHSRVILQTWLDKKDVKVVLYLLSNINSLDSIPQCVEEITRDYNVRVCYSINCLPLRIQDIVNHLLRTE